MKLKFWLQTNMVGSHTETTIDVDDEEWGELTTAEREEYAKDMFWDIALDRLGAWDWEEL